MHQDFSVVMTSCFAIKDTNLYSFYGFPTISLCINSKIKHHRCTLFSNILYIFTLGFYIGGIFLCFSQSICYYFLLRSATSPTWEYLNKRLGNGVTSCMKNNNSLHTNTKHTFLSNIKLFRKINHIGLMY